MTYARPTGVTCPKHELPTVVTQSGLQHVCVQPDCDFSVRLQGPRKADAEMTKPENNDQDRKKKIDEVVAKKKAAAAASPPPKPADAPKPKKTEKETPPAKVAKKGADAELDANVKKGKKPDDPDMMSVSDVARSLGLDPKRARAKLRASGMAATEGRWEKVKRGSKKYQELVALLAPPDEPEEEEEEETEEEDDE